MSDPGITNDTVSGIIQKLDIRFSTEQNLSQQDLPLQGLTFAVKDMFAVKGETAGFGSPDWKKSHGPAARNAPSVDRVLEGGAHLVANTICDELAFSLDGINMHYGTPLNPRAPERIPGGSSSGPASVVAQGLVDFALGTDTAGSTRVPASYCGIWGLRPTAGSIDCQGVWPLGPTFDTVGLLAQSLDILARVTSVLIEDCRTGKAKKLIIVPECFSLLDPSLLPPLVAEQNRLRPLFDTCEERDVVEDGLAALVNNFGAIRSFEAWQCHGKWFETTAPNLSPPVAKRLLACRGSSEEEARKSRLYRQSLQVKFRDLLDGAVLCLPTTAQIPPLKTATDEALEANRSLNLRLNSIASFVGLPQLTIPISQGRQRRWSAGPAPGLSPGLSLIGAEGSEHELLRLAGDLTN